MGSDEKEDVMVSDEKEDVMVSDDKQAMVVSDVKQAMLVSDDKQAMIVSDDKQVMVVPDDKQVMIVPNNKDVTTTTTPKSRGGRPLDQLWNHFMKTSAMKNKWISMAACKYCVQAHQENPETVPEQPLVPGRVDSLSTHLKHCPFAKKVLETLVLAKGGISPENLSGVANSKEKTAGKGYFLEDASPLKGRQLQGLFEGNEVQILKRQKAMPTCTEAPFSEDKRNTFHSLLLEFTVDNDLPIQWIERPSTKRLFEFLNPMAVSNLPIRKTSSSTTTDQE